MVQFSVSLTGLVIAVSALYPGTEAFCREFLSSEQADFSVSISQADIDYELTRSSGMSDPAYLETLALLRRIAEKLIDYDTVLFHGSVLAVDGKAYLFTAPSGTGKTTHSRLWLENVPGCHILNGDKPFLRIMEDGKVLACGSPWRGKENYGINEILPLEGICILERDTYNHIEPVSCKDALGRLVRQTFRPADPQLMLKALQLAGIIGQSVNLFHMGCTMDPEAALVSSAIMIRK